MHLLFDNGVVDMEFKLISYFIEHDIITIATLNNAIETFEYTTEENRDKPHTLSTTALLKKIQHYHSQQLK